MDVFMLNVADYISPECTCNIEDMTAKLDHVVSAEFNPLTQVLKVTAHERARDHNKVTGLRKLKGIGVALASTILTFHNPKDYCVYDIHIMREVYDQEPNYMFTSNKHYLKLLKDLRIESKKLDLPVRTIEKALFKKNIDSSRK